MTFSKAKLIPLIMKLGDYLKSGMDHYIELKAAGVAVDADIVGIFINEQLKSWHPKIAGKMLLDDETRSACARFLGGLVVNISK